MRGEEPGFTGFSPWWAVALGIGVVLDAIYVWRAGYPPKARKHRA